MWDGFIPTPVDRSINFVHDVTLNNLQSIIT